MFRKLAIYATCLAALGCGALEFEANVFHFGSSPIRDHARQIRYLRDEQEEHIKKDHPDSPYSPCKICRGYEDQIRKWKRHRGH